MSVIELYQTDTDKKDMKTRNALGFERKFLHLNDNKNIPSNKTEELMDKSKTLDMKAHLSSPKKGLVNYTTKSEVVFKLDGG